MSKTVFTTGNGNYFAVMNKHGNNLSFLNVVLCKAAENLDALSLKKEIGLQIGVICY